LKKKLAIILTLALLITLLCGCSKETGASDASKENAQASEATDSATAVANVCETNGHDFEDATCEKPKTCKVCGETEGEALEHVWGIRTVDSAKTCENCGATEGEPISVKINEVIVPKDDATIYHFPDFYVTYYWEDKMNSDYGFEVATNFVTIYDNDNNVVKEYEFGPDEVSSGYGVWIAGEVDDLYIILLGIDGYGKADQSVILNAEGEKVWENNVLPEYYCWDCSIHADNNTFAVMVNYENEELVKYVNIATDEVLDELDPSVVGYPLHYDLKVEGYPFESYSLKSNSDSNYYLAKFDDELQWGIIDKDLNVLKQYKDCSAVADSGYLFASDDRKTYYLVDTDFNVVGVNIIEACGSYLVDNTGNTFVLTAEDGKMYRVVVE